MKKIVLAVALAMFGLSQPAMAQSEVSVGGSTVDVKNGKDSKQLELGYASSLTVPKLGVVDYAAVAELGDGVKTLGVTGGRKLTVGKATVTPGLELGYGSREVTQKVKSGYKTTLVTDDEGYGFGGASLNVSYPLPLTPAGLSLDAGVRYRESLTDDVDFDETRVFGGVKYAFSDKQTLGVEARKTTGTVKSNGIGLKFTQKF